MVIKENCKCRYSNTECYDALVHAKQRTHLSLNVDLLYDANQIRDSPNFSVCTDCIGEGISTSSKTKIETGSERYIGVFNLTQFPNRIGLH